MAPSPSPWYEARGQGAPTGVGVERIVVGTDMSSRSGGAVTVAAELADAMGATLHLVSACPMPTVAMGPEAVVIPDHGEVLDSTKADLENLASDLRRRGLSVEIHTPLGDAADALCSVAETVDANLIVVGNKRMKGAARLLGSVPNRVAHKAPCSVLIAHTA
jgi:nucleotide-binding universal stress UspA family protein